MKHLDEWAEYLLAVEGRSPRTVDQYRGIVRRVGRALRVEDPADLSFGVLEGYLRAQFAAGRAQSTRATTISAVKSFCSYLAARGILEVSPARDLRRPRVYQSEAPHLTVPEVHRLIHGPIARGVERSPWVVRDRVLLATMYVLGLRSSEPGRIRLEDLGWVEGERVFSVRIRGAKWQGRDVRLTMPEDVSRLLGQYVELVRAAPAGEVAVFPSQTGAGVSRSVVAKAFSLRVREAEIEPKGRSLTPHILRHSIATHLLAAGWNPRRVQRHMRHKSLETTMLYLHTGDSAATARDWRKRHPIKTHQRRERSISMHTAVKQFARDLQEL